MLSLEFVLMGRKLQKIAAVTEESLFQLSLLKSILGMIFYKATTVLKTTELPVLVKEQKTISILGFHVTF